SSLPSASVVIAGERDVRARTAGDVSHSRLTDVACAVASAAVTTALHRVPRLRRPLRARPQGTVAVEVAPQPAIARAHAPAGGLVGFAKDIVALTKPRITLMAGIVAAGAMLLAPGAITLADALYSLLGIAMAVAGAGALN